MADHPNGLVKDKQSRMANVKCATSAVPPERVVALFAAFSPDASIAYAVHNEEGKVEHAHYVVRFPATVRWTKVAQTLRDIDGHEYAEPAKSWRRSVRYLLHLDNPEKARIPRESLRSVNLDESELSMLLGAARLPILESLALAERLPLSERFSFLVVERGHQPSEVSAALRCMLDLERWSDCRTARMMRRDGAGSALDADAVLAARMPSDDASDPFPDEDEAGASLLDDDINPFSED